MDKEVWLLLFIGHVLGDFYFQSSSLAKAKETSVKKLRLHCLLYLVAMVGVTLAVFNWSLFSVAIVVSVLHFVIDGLKFLLTKYVSIKKDKNATIFLADQGLHILVLLLAAGYIKIHSIEINYVTGLEFLINMFDLDMEHLLSWILILLVLVQPCSIVIKKVLNRYRPMNEEQLDEGVPNAGALIGILERLFILLMLYVNQFTAIGFVLTAKSIARYNKISENPQFAEYYLLGTLMSTLLIIISYFLIFL
ncbi:MAG TPA: DUF3307 domain-containing protein [Candidatus Jeotgalibaca pullicola]|nr:DUF3307 domain-containing protein [Candidatus Jeotgalibaca pullicola]